MKDGGWNKLKHLSPDDLAIGCLFIGEEAEALHNTLIDVIDTIKVGPVTYTYRGDKANKLFTLSKEKVRKSNHFLIDADFLKSYGVFTLEASLWDCLKLYASWIDPLLVNQWVQVMSGYESNFQRNLSLQTYHDCLVWLDKSHDTKVVRKRIEQLKAENHRITSAWSNAEIKPDYQVDHCLPFSYWPNNDRWNLLPASRHENNTKLNRVPSKKRLADSKQRIIHFWELAWSSEQEQQRFFNEAALSLPSVTSDIRDLKPFLKQWEFKSLVCKADYWSEIGRKA